ncbi:hypothetical protein ACXYRO_00760 [Mycoplasma sp. 4013]
MLHFKKAPDLSVKLPEIIMMISIIHHTKPAPRVKKNKTPVPALPT